MADCAANFYVATAAVLQASLLGVEQALELPKAETNLLQALGPDAGQALLARLRDNLNPGGRLVSKEGKTTYTTTM